VGRLDGFTDKVNRDPYAMKGSYNEIIRKKKDSCDKYLDAVATIIAQREKKVQRLKVLSEESNRLERLKSGAAAKAKEIVAELQSKGKTPEEIKANPDFIKCQSSFADFAATLDEKMKLITELEASVQEYSKNIDGHKLKLITLQREIDNLKTEAADAVADVISASEEASMSRVIAGISNDGTSESLEQLREVRSKAKAEAKITSELAGTDHKIVEAEFEQFAQDHASNAEFDALIGLGVSDDVKINDMEDRLKKMDAEPVTAEN